MSVDVAVRELLAQEARALITRLDRVKPFSLHETMVLAAAPAPAAMDAIERFLIRGRRVLRNRALGYLAWLQGPGRTASPAEQQRMFVRIRMGFNNVLSQFDLFTEVISQRSEHETGVWLAGLDVVAADALDVATPYATPSPLVCFLARGPGAAIRRARTRLPGGAPNPVGIIRVPRERMVGHGIASSLVHEVGHAGAALLGLVESLVPVLHEIERSADPDRAKAWKCWRRWVSEIVSDLWSVGRLGISSTLGLFAVVSLPKFFVFRPSGDDPHPIPYVRVHLSAAIGQELYPHPQWDALSRTWAAMYPLGDVTDAHRRRITRLLDTMPEFVSVLASHRPPALRGRTLGETLASPARRPEQLLAAFQRWSRDPSEVETTSPTFVFGAVGQARAAGLISAEDEGELIARLLRQWALRSTLDITAICAGRTAVAGPYRN
jgi:hypothetical protein